MNRANRPGPWIAACACGLAALAASAQPVAYPFKGQSPQQQQRDDGECYLWAKNSTHIDPAAVAAAPTAPPPGAGGQRVAGAATGAIVGGLVDGSDGARTGAAIGIVGGGMHARQQRRHQQAAAQANKQGALDTFQRAYGACMESRGYTVR